VGVALRAAFAAAADGLDCRVGGLENAQDAVGFGRSQVGNQISSPSAPGERDRLGWGGLSVIHLWLPLTLVCVLAGAGTYGVMARRNAVLVLVGVELLLNAANLLFVTMGSVASDTLRTGHVLTLFLITIAAAEMGVALAVILALFRDRGHIDLSEPGT
jgi:NADH-quinone oxidoreductase subunit K